MFTPRAVEQELSDSKQAITAAKQEMSTLAAELDEMAAKHERDRRLLEAQVRTNHNTASSGHMTSILIPDWLVGEGPAEDQPGGHMRVLQQLQP